MWTESLFVCQVFLSFGELRISNSFRGVCVEESAMHSQKSSPVFIFHVNKYVGSGCVRVCVRACAHKASVNKSD